MMSRLQSWKPAQLLWIAGIANIASTLPVIILAALLWHLPKDQHLPLQVKIPACLAILSALAVSLHAESALKRGIRSDAWPESLLSGPRKFLASRTFSVIATVTALSFLIPFIALPVGGGFLAPLFLMLPQSFGRMKFSLSPPSTEPIFLISLGSSLHAAKPIHSEHWGAHRPVKPLFIN